MRSINPATAIILLLMGAVLLIMGLVRIVKYFAMIKKPYVTVKGEICGCDRDVHHHKFYTSTVCRVKLRFEYEGKQYTVTDENAIPESVYDRVYGDSVECNIRIMNGEPYSATLDDKDCLAAGRNEGLKFAGIAVVIIVFALL